MEKNTVRSGILLSILAVASVFAGTSPAIATGTVGEYRPMPLIGGGYTQKKLAENRWRVTGFSIEKVEERSTHLALYRGGLIMKLKGQSFMQVVDAYREIEYYIGGKANETSRFVITGVASADTPLHCEAKKEMFRELCRTLGVEDAINTFGKYLGKTPEQISEDFDNIKASPPKENK